MEDAELQSPKTGNIRNASTHPDRNISEPVRSRWTPKPEQILILESIFNSGMVNPPKDETVRIRKLLEKFGTVGDANVFYWFQNRRSRSRRRQRQIQAGLVVENNLTDAHSFQTTPSGVPTSYDCGFGGSGFLPQGFSSVVGCVSGAGGGSSSSGSGCDGFDDLFTMSSQMGFMGMDHGSDVSSVFGFDSSNLQFRPQGFVTVFINGVATEVPRGPIDMKGFFGDNESVLVHSSGVPLPVNDFGFSTQSLQHGESYYVVSRTA